MSAAVLVADSWQPSIVQLVPFANAKIQRRNSFKDQGDSKRCFPILAVTRSQSGLSTEESVVSVKTYSSLICSDSKREVCDSGQYSARSSTASLQKEKRFRKSARHSSLRENRNDIMVKFAIQDLNEQSENAVQRRNSVSSSDTGISLSTVSAAGSSTSNGLPKPTFSDKKYLYRQNGFKKASSFTPGEIELQKQKDMYAKEQAQKRKKYKLNVNQLPRSNTPIQDHDPDKLNMKQVIRFLQKQKPSVSPRPETNRQKTLFECAPKTAPANLTVGDNIRSDLKTSDSMRSRSSEMNIARRSKLVSRDSDIPIVTSPTQNTRYHLSHKNDKGSVSKSYTDKRGLYPRSYESHVRNYASHENSRERDKNRHSKKRERIREFKLHRFLTVAPNGEGQKTNPLVISNIAQSRSTNWASVREGLKSEGGDKIRFRSEERLPFRRVSSERPLPSHYITSNKVNADVKLQSSNEKQNEAVIEKPVIDSEKNSNGKSANNLHYRVQRFQKWIPRDDISITDSDDGKLSLTNSSMIRLPSVHDFLEEDEEETVQSSSKSDFEIKSRTQESDTDFEQHRETNVSRTSVDSYRSSVFIPILAPSHRKGVNAKPKQSLHISLPKEEEDTKEIRLSLRQEKGLTAQRSYMSDIASGRSTDTIAMVCNRTNGHVVPASCNAFNDNNSFRISTVSVRNGKLEDCWVCDDTRLSPDPHMTNRSIGALSTN